MRSTKTKDEIFRDGFSLFVDKPIPEEIFQGYMNDEDGEATTILQDFISGNMKDEIADWCTAIGVIEAVEHLHVAAFENGNLSHVIR